MKNFLFMCILFASKLGHSAALKKTLELKEWPSFVESLVYYQKFNPGVFTPIELIRVDRLPSETFREIVVRHGKIWQESGKKVSYSLRDDTLIGLSRATNQDLQQLIKQFKKENPKKTLEGSHAWLLEALNPKNRTALSLLDPVFKASLLGEKIKKLFDLKPGIMPLAYTVKNDRILFEGLPPAWTKLNLDPKAFAEMQVERLGGEEGKEIKIRSFFKGDSHPAVEDIRTRREYFRGSLFNDKDPSPFPFGNFPQGQDVFSSEGSSGHFSGDGHNHAP